EAGAGNKGWTFTFCSPTLKARSQGAQRTARRTGGPDGCYRAPCRRPGTPAPAVEGSIMLLLTPRQLAAYQFIAGFIEREQVAPSYEELRCHLGLRSLNAVAKLVTQLRRRGALASAPLNAKRSLVPTARAMRSRST